MKVRRGYLKLVVLRRRLYRESTNCHQCPDGDVFQRHFLSSSRRFVATQVFRQVQHGRAFQFRGFHNSCPFTLPIMAQLHYGSSTLT